MVKNSLVRSAVVNNDSTVTIEAEGYEAAERTVVLEDRAEKSIEVRITRE